MPVPFDATHMLPSRQPARWGANWLITKRARLRPWKVTRLYYPSYLRAAPLSESGNPALAAAVRQP